MFGSPSRPIGRLFGIPIEVNSSWFLVFFLVSLGLATSYFPQALPELPGTAHAALAFATALAFFASIVIHELAHSLVARAGGLKVRRVTLFMFGGVSQMEEEPKSPLRELLMALAGPMTSFALGGIGLAALTAFGSAMPDALRVPLEYLTFINFSVGAFNLLPGFPLDGGRVLRSILWGLSKDILKATRWATRTGQAIGLSLVAIAVYGVLRGQIDAIWLAVMGWFISLLASNAYAQQVVRSRLAAIRLSEAMSSPVVTVPADTPLAEVAEAYVLGGRHSRYPVVAEGRVVGLVDLASVRSVPRDAWLQTTVGDVAMHDLSSVVAAPEASVESVLPQLEPDGPGAVLVVEGGRLAGIVTRADVIRLLRERPAQP
ncbi:MAG: site-2 protease family protein [Anaerosomatales bacterium]|nr:site-2 protease family protein [Anaerosomatales bacterium]